MKYDMLNSSKLYILTWIKKHCFSLVFKKTGSNAFVDEILVCEWPIVKECQKSKRVQLFKVKLSKGKNMVKNFEQNNCSTFLEQEMQDFYSITKLWQRIQEAILCKKFSLKTIKSVLNSITVNYFNLDNNIKYQLNINSNIEPLRNSWLI